MSTSQFCVASTGQLWAQGVLSVSPRALGMGTMNRSCTAVKMCPGAGGLHLSASFLRPGRVLCIHMKQNKIKPKFSKRGSKTT